MRLDVSSESSTRQRIHLKHQALISSKDKSKKLKCHLLQFLFGALRVNIFIQFIYSCIPVRWELPFHNTPKNLDPSYKMNLDFLDRFKRQKTILRLNYPNMVYIVLVPVYDNFGLKIQKQPNNPKHLDPSQNRILAICIKKIKNSRSYG